MVTTDERSAFLEWPLRVLAVPYGLLVGVRTALYEHGWLPQRRLPCRVVSVGNLTVGGTGKTPVVIAIVEWLLARGRRVAVLSRGYRRVSRSPQVVVSDGSVILADPDEAGDEPYLIAHRCPGAVVAVGSDRYRLGRWVLEQFPVDFAVLDDGFQHRALHRDVDLLLVDGSDPTGIRALLPAGRLREPLSAAARATGLVLTRADDPGAREVLSTIREAVGPRLPPVSVRFQTEALVHVRTGAKQDPTSVGGRPTVMFSGIANPASFKALLVGQGCRIVTELVFPDHHRYSAADVQAVREWASQRGADLIVTTEKDAFKVAPLVGPDEPFWAVRLGTEIMQGRKELERLIFGGNG
jgi:tetraacyldisaccharide 4'-kinase